MHGNVADDSVKRRANRVVAEQLFLRLARFDRRLVIRLRIVVGLLRLIVGVAAGHARVEQLVLPVELDRVVVKQSFLLPLGRAL